MPREKTSAGVTVKKRAPRKTAASAARVKESKASPEFTSFVGPEQRLALIAEAAYFRAERRGFAPGHDAADWLAAESEVDARLLHGAKSTPRG